MVPPVVSIALNNRACYSRRARYADRKTKSQPSQQRLAHMTQILHAHIERKLSPTCSLFKWRFTTTPNLKALVGCRYHSSQATQRKQPCRPRASCNDARQDDFVFARSRPHLGTVSSRGSCGSGWPVREIPSQQRRARWQRPGGKHRERLRALGVARLRGLLILGVVWEEMRTRHSDSKSRRSTSRTISVAECYESGSVMIFWVQARMPFRMLV